MIIPAIVSYLYFWYNIQPFESVVNYAMQN
jgi:hypothetical protein